MKRPPAPRLALRIEEAAASLGVSPDHFREYVAPELRWLRLGRVRLVGIDELARFIEKNSARAIIDDFRVEI